MSTHGDGGKGSGRRNEDVSKVKSNWDLIDWSVTTSNKAPVTTYLLKEVKPMEHNHEDTYEDQDNPEDYEDGWQCDMCGGPMYRQSHWSYGQCDDCGARQELENDDY